VIGLKQAIRSPRLGAGGQSARAELPGVFTEAFPSDPARVAIRLAGRTSATRAPSPAVGFFVLLLLSCDQPVLSAPYSALHSSAHFGFHGFHGNTRHIARGWCPLHI
jgi:hypothetical protein